MTILKYSNRGNDFFTNQLMNQLFRETRGALKSTLDNEVVNRTSVNVYEEENNFIIEMAIPGFAKEDVSIKVEKGVLNISANKEEKQERNYLRREFTRGNLEKSFKLSDGIAEEEINAEVKDGMLFVKLPKMQVEEPKAREIEIR